MDQETTIDVLYNVALDKLKVQLHQVDALDTKVGVTYALANGLVVALLGFMALVAQPVQWYVVVFASLTGTAYLVALYPLFVAYKISRWDAGPDLAMLQHHCLNPDFRDHPELIKQWVASECVRAYVHNNKPCLADKSQAASWAIIVVSIQAAMLAATAILSLGG